MKLVIIASGLSVCLNIFQGEYSHFVVKIYNFLNSIHVAN